MNKAAMETKLIDGKIVSKEIKKNLKVRIEVLKSGGVVPGLVAIWVGENPASQIYVRSKAKAAEKIGIYSEIIKKPADICRFRIFRTISA